jgi:hypothetical protein
MQLKPILLSTLILTFTLFKAQSQQKDYIITTKGDTIGANIKLDFWSGKVLYQLPGAKRFKPVDDNTVEQYFWSENNNATFIAIILPGNNSPTFVKLLERGKINLYEVVSHSGKTSTKYWYASKPNAPIFEINNERRLLGTDKQLKRNFTALLSDNQRLLQSFNQQNKYSFKLIRYSIQQYNAG